MPENKNQPPNQKQPYLIVVEGIVPVRAMFETWAYDEEEALAQLDKPQLLRIRERPDVDIPKIRRSKVTVKEVATSQVKLTKNY